MVIVKPYTRINHIRYLLPKQGSRVVSVQVSHITSVLNQLPLNMSTSRNRTFTHGKGILIRLHLLVRFQNDFALDFIVLVSTITASGQSRHHLMVAGFVHEHTATGSAFASCQGIDINTSLADKANLLELSLFRGQTSKPATTSQRHDIREQKIIRAAHKKLSPL